MALKNNTSAQYSYAAVSPAGYPVFVSCPDYRWLIHTWQYQVKNDILEQVSQDGLDPQEFGYYGIPQKYQWSADQAVEVMRKCLGIIIFAFTRFEVSGDDGEVIRMPTEYNHFEGGIGLGLGLPTLIITEEGIRPRGVVFPAMGAPIVYIPREACSDWRTRGGFFSAYKQWLDAIRQKKMSYSCFISYTKSDEDFCQRLYSYLQRSGVNVWYAPNSIRPGRKIYDEVSEAISVSDRVLIILSNESIASGWVETELRLVRKAEKEMNRNILFPIGLAKYEAIQSWVCFDADVKKDIAAEIREYYLPDFSEWKSLDKKGKLEVEFEKLVQILKK